MIFTNIVVFCVLNAANLVVLSNFVLSTVSIYENRLLTGRQAKKEYFDILKAKLRQHRGEVIDQWLSGNYSLEGRKDRSYIKTVVSINWNLSTQWAWAKHTSAIDNYTYREWCMLHNGLLKRDSRCQDEKAYFKHHSNNSVSAKYRKKIETIRQCACGFIKSGYWSNFQSGHTPQCIVRGADARPGLFSMWQGVFLSAHI